MKISKNIFHPLLVKLAKTSTIIAGLGFAQAAFSQVIINEVDADQTSTDSAEFIELFDGGSGNTDLSGLRLVLINGSNDTIYADVDLAELSTNDAGYFVLCGNPATVPNCDLQFGPATNTIQNGQDAVALISSDTEIAILADFSASDVVDGLVYDTSDSDDIVLINLLTPGQAQINEDENGLKDVESNQRCENGSGGPRVTSSYAQFEPTPGTVNLCGDQPTTPPDIFINEVDADTPGTDAAEFIELYDGGDGNTDLSGLSLLLYNGNGDSIYAEVSLDELSTNDAGFFVVCGNAANVENCDLDVLSDSNAIQNGADAVAVVIGSSADFPIDSNFPADENIIDAFVYDTDDADDTGLLVLLNPGQAQINENGSGNKDNESNQRCTNGSGGLRDTNTFAQFEPSPGAVNTCGVVVADNIVINEIDADQTSTDSAEFVELYDGGAGNTDLSGLSLVFFNGGGDASYLFADLQGQTTDDNGYFVVCGNVAAVANCDLDIGGDTNLIQNGADAVALLQGLGADFADVVTAVNSGAIVDAIVYGTNDSDDTGLLTLLNEDQPQVNESSNGNNTTESNQRCENGSGGARNTDTFEQFEPTPGTENTCDNSNGGGDAEFTFIHNVQGSGFSSPLEGQSVIIEGIVTATFQGTGELGGFYVQEEDADADADPATSEGIYVADTNNLVTVNSLVRVTGAVSETRGDQTIISAQQVEILSTGNPLPTSVTLSMPVSSLSEFEQNEGMQVNFSQALIVNDHFNLGRFGEVILSSERKFQFTHNNVPSVEGYAAHLAALERDQIVLDDGLSIQNPEPTAFPVPGLSASNTLRLGASTSPAGVLGQDFGFYRILPTGPVSFADDNPRPEAPADVGGNFTVASFNVLNYFTTIDENGSTCGPNGLGCRGADSSEEFTRQSDKIINALVAIDADIVGLVELENNASASLQSIVSKLNAQMGEGTYSFVDTGTIGTDAIKVGLIYKPANVSIQGAFGILDSSVDPTFLDTRNRPALAQTFITETDEVFTVSVNHFKSKGSACDSQGDPDLQDGQANCQGVRADAATALVGWLANDPTNSGDEDFLILGDLNAYAMEDAISNIKNAGYVNLVDAFEGALAYSFVFSGELGYLDYALATRTLTEKVTGVSEWHVNADEPRVLDYNVEFQSPTQVDSLYAPDVFRNSDHDPIILGFDFGPDEQADADEDGIFDGLDNCSAVPNSSQLDSNGDGFGNICDGDLNNDGIVNFIDLGLLRRVFFTNDPDADLNGDGIVNFVDFAIMRGLFFKPPGPGAIAAE